MAACGILAGAAFSTAPVRAQQPSAAAPLSDSAPQPIDLVTALRLAGINNLDLKIVRDAERQAKAANDAATLRFFPSLSIGELYARRTGADQQTAGTMLEVDKQLYRRGASVGIALDVGDAIFGKLAARQLETAAAHTVEAQRNDVVLRAASAYFDLVSAAAEVDIARDALRISRQYQDQLERAVAIGITNKSEALRVSVQTQQAEITLRAAQAAQRGDSAELAVVLRLDPATVLVPRERVVVPATLVPLDTSMNALVAAAIAARPELAASAAAVSAAEHQQTAARYGPLIPSITAAATYGQTRGGADGLLSPYQATHDYAVGLSWRFGPGGLFDFSRTEAADARLDRQRLTDTKLRDSISQQVVVALSGAQAALDQMHLARHGVELAQQSLQLSMQRKEFGVYAVLEVIQAQQDLTRARSSYA
ncbi:MAG: TolC family protein, partial [Steroidobacteraceae bacterium]